jgi:N-acetylmuramoyl-L-alanine amidase
MARALAHALPRAPAHSSRGAPSRTAVADSPYDRALRLREALEGQPRQQRTRRDYDRVMEAFRAVYHGAPRGANADASVDAVAELLAEQGRLFETPKASEDAIGQYEFLRREYPASRYRYSALLTEGEVYSRDLDDRVAARTIFLLFLKLYPQNALADEARQELEKMRADSPARGSPAAASASPRTGRLGRTHAHHNAVLDAALASRNGALPGSVSRAGPLGGQSLVQPGARQQASAGVPAAAGAAARQRAQSPPTQSPASPPASAAASDGSRAGASTLVEHDLPSQPSGQSAGSLAGAAASQGGRRGQEPLPNATLSQAALNAPPPLPRRGRLPLVTGVRHWSTAVYTRVAIDLDAEVQYEASRVPNPDRIFFDLHGAKLSPELIGKAVVVTDGGFLKRIRAAQFSNDMVRVVLDVSNVSEYSAFFLPNPARLIIDIHGINGQAPGSVPMERAASAKGAAARGTLPTASKPIAKADSSAAAPLVTVPRLQALPRPARLIAQAAPPDQSPGPADASASHSRTATGKRAGAQSDALGEIASLDHQPDTVRATRSPTTAPIVASVADTRPAPQPDTVLAPAPELVSRRPHVADSKATRSRGLTPADTPAPAIHAADPPAATRTAAPTATGERSMVRALGLKIGRIVVDAGHGGHDSGTLGPGGIEEKDIVLDVALRLGRLLKQRLGADVIYTRDDDTFIPLETRTAIANKAQADLFISVHANSSQDASARGVETYYLNFTSSADALEVAARENAVSDQSIHQLSDLVKKITLQDKISESREFAGDVEQSLFTGLESGNPGLRDRGVKKAPFVVLIGANMPSILAEISFLTNPDDAHQLRDPEYRQRIAESLYRGVAKYIGSLGGVRLAEGTARPTGQ